MTERERLVELLDKKYDHFCDQCGVNKDSCYTENLADYLLASGVIVPPCKVGNPLYFLSGDLEKCKIIESSSWLYIVDSLGLITIEETLYELCYKYDYDYVFGVTVFSTYEEAEKALHKINHNSLCETETYKIKQ